MRSKTSKAFAWIIVFILVIGLAGFGIQDVLRSSGQNEIISFGEQKVSSDDYIRMIQQETRLVSQRLGTNLTFQEAQGLGVTQIALQKLVTSAILDQTLDDIGISQSNSSVEKSIKSNSNFLDIAGRFNVEKYKNVLLNANLQPSEYEEILRKELSRDILLKLVTTNIGMDSKLQQLISSYYLEERVANILKITEKNLSKPGVTISESEALTFYNSSKETFTQPKTKKISFIYLSPKDIVQDQVVSEDEIKEAFNLEKDLINTPEKRLIDQLFFDDLNSARSALAEDQKKLLTFEKIRLERGLKRDDVSLGAITKSELPINVQESLFSAPSQSIRGPFKTELGFAIYRVNEIVPAVVKNFMSERLRIKEQIELEKANYELNELANFVNDEIAGGVTLENIAKSTKMSFGQLDIFTGAELPEFATTATFIEMMRSAKSYASDVQFDERGGIISVRVNETVEPFVKDFNTIKDLAKQKALTKKIHTKLEEQAAEIIEDQIMTDRSLAKIPLSEQYEIEEDKSYKRYDQPADLPSDFIKKLFSLDKMEVGVIVENRKAFIIQLQTIVPVEQEADDNKKFKQQIDLQFNSSMKQDILNAFIKSLERNHPLLINQKAIDAAIARFN